MRGSRLGDAVGSRDRERFLRGAAGGVADTAGAVCWGGVRAGLCEEARVLRGAGGGVRGTGRFGGALRGVLGVLGMWRFGGVLGEEGERFGEGLGFFDGVSGSSSSSSSSSLSSSLSFALRGGFAVAGWFVGSCATTLFVASSCFFTLSSLGACRDCLPKEDVPKNFCSSSFCSTSRSESPSMFAESQGAEVGW